MQSLAARTASPPLPDFATLYQEQSKYVWRTLRRLGVREADLPDASQETFIIIHRKLPEFAGRSSLKTWIFAICLRFARDWRNRAHVRRESLEDAPERSTSGETPTRQIALKQARHTLDRMLDALDEDKRAVFVLFELEELPMNEVAEAVECPVQTAYARLYAARKFIEHWLVAHQEAR
jgi:RNA polymerase sigma-70 factor (ECF subfamily)